MLLLSFFNVNVTILCLIQKLKEYLLYHNHPTRILYDEFGLSDRKELKNLIDRNIPKIKKCITFFKTIAENETNSKIKADILASVAEDEARLEDFEEHKPKFFVF
ncbi:MAG: hypothetical protein ACD_46C00025G0005 [uncultured bacterium]|nr:MAG: hypothetical protein ACD_46C00025G0005 [uncultured bacterium]